MALVSLQALMRKGILKIAVTSGLWVLLSASARAQDGPPTPNEATGHISTKHLSATGRMTEPCVRASRLVGAQVNDMSGDSVGQIRDFILNPHSGRVDFALLSLNGAAANTNMTPNANASENLVPVPWALLRSSAAEYSAGSEQPEFTLKADRNRLAHAPTVDWSDPNQSQWRQRIYSYYGVTPPAPAPPASTGPSPRPGPDP